MSRQVYVFRNGKAIPKREAEPIIPPSPRSSLASPMVIRDTVIEGQLHPCTGEIIHSKAEFRKITKAHGCVEVGNERIPAYTAPKDDIQKDIAQAWQEAEQKSEWDKIPETPESPDLTNQSLTILAQPGQSTKELRAATMGQAEIREAQPAKAPQVSQDLTPTKN